MPSERQLSGHLVVDPTLLWCAARWLRVQRGSSVVSVVPGPEPTPTLTRDARCPEECAQVYQGYRGSLLPAMSMASAQRCFGGERAAWDLIFTRRGRSASIASAPGRNTRSHSCSPLVTQGDRDAGQEVCPPIAWTALRLPPDSR